MNTSKFLLVPLLALAVATPIAGLLGDIKAKPIMSDRAASSLLDQFQMASSPDHGELSSLGRAGEWLNSQPLTPESLRGKVVLINFWTYTCINWRRQLPYVRAWQEKYRDQGLVVIGVHAPEFEFEKNTTNVRWATTNMNIAYPVAVDSTHAIWRGFDNQAWPALYFIDSQGRVRHRVLGEGGYEESEKVIQSLLREAGASDVSRAPVVVSATGAEAAADWADLGSPENYLGFERTENFASPGGASADTPQVYRFPNSLRLNEWALSGEWTVRNDAVALRKRNGRITYRFHARDLNLVMGPAPGAAPIRFRITLDGQPPGTAHGVDVDSQRNGTMTEQRMYSLVRQPDQITDRDFVIEFLDDGAEAFALSFG
ncbi:redoxin domain-containing protein [Bradyrhizobium centrosematis]|uniref:redoxin domain-containing protein n=1 Tax=Bradyrhizobium centrosematis TaxID=1300039 RepID=UPI002166C3FD|nr:redoxin domain-containing protein [Bradyrhizobium centrosematis]MCS3763107.1 thiol-disulfide isomerase/thioredoxin [Bradyrhizobium centrosematis]MCS3775774.1 thiol-disulfide isomerase/thioredoxin [Bradyrhizobium centrosematis]